MLDSAMDGVPYKPNSSSASSSMSNNNNKEKKRSGKRSKGVNLSTDPQSVAARQRRHRISDRFKILQSLVPGGTKMDTVSMLEEAIHYVKYLKTQIWLHEAMINFTDDDSSLFFTCNSLSPQQSLYSSDDGGTSRSNWRVVDILKTTTLLVPMYVFYAAGILKTTSICLPPAHIRFTYGQICSRFSCSKAVSTPVGGEPLDVPDGAINREIAANLEVSVLWLLPPIRWVSWKLLRIRVGIPCQVTVGATDTGLVVCMKLIVILKGLEAVIQLNLTHIQIAPDSS
ncbi:hypothetical protein HHK36_016161 [Tetracentron sinense]|uniref:BHLH domain-containing protein n=1 Tax=Tetracentron sinense TaxID=13715 RepID=A0A834Z4T0_TETSI|nr:hypothetical protein HHK36_016161 [Tetracentron sinense]